MHASEAVEIVKANLPEGIVDRVKAAAPEADLINVLTYSPPDQLDLVVTFVDIDFPFRFPNDPTSPHFLGMPPDDRSHLAVDFVVETKELTGLGPAAIGALLESRFEAALERMKILLEQMKAAKLLGDQPLVVGNQS